MKTRVLVFLIFTATLFALGTVITIIFNTTPSTREIFALFYTSLLITLFGLIFLGYYGTLYFAERSMPSWSGTVSALRAALVGSIFVTAILGIQSVRLLNVATFLILLLLAVISELVMRRKSLKSS